MYHKLVIKFQKSIGEKHYRKIKRHDLFLFDSSFTKLSRDRERAPPSDGSFPKRPPWPELGKAEARSFHLVPRVSSQALEPLSPVLPGPEARRLTRSGAMIHNHAVSERKKKMV